MGKSDSQHLKKSESKTKMTLNKVKFSLRDDPKMQVRSPMAEGVCDERNDDVEYMMSTCRKARPVALLHI
jgi:hypothetical protein